jgi:hypothetical protein
MAESVNREHMFLIGYIQSGQQAFIRVYEGYLVRGRCNNENLDCER